MRIGRPIWPTQTLQGSVDCGAVALCRPAHFRCFAVETGTRAIRILMIRKNEKKEKKQRNKGGFSLSLTKANTNPSKQAKRNKKKTKKRIVPDRLDLFLIQLAEYGARTHD